MKKILILAALAVSIGNASAQEEGQTKSKPKDERNKLHLGIKLGVNNSNVYDEQGEEFKSEPKYGFAGGLFLSVPVGKYLGLQPGALISQKGFRATGKLFDETYELSRTTTYLDVPVLIEFKPLKIITLVGGPQYSYLLHQADVITGGDNASIQQEEFKNDNIRKNILSAAVGFDLNLGRFVISGRYNFDLQQNNGDGSSMTPRYKNIWLQGTIGTRF
ncbi:MAG: hypothetical protein K0S44_2808 [Bacteroidetes bacterium]|jgi:hypothetical protein|nr:hypothetical protein [Bacteroidota bacterium]